MSEKQRYLITAALPYANGPVHIGHLAGCYLPSDIYTRYLKAKGEDVFFVCGSDEHGVPITLKARKEGVSPQEVVDKYHLIMKSSFEEFGIEFTYYGRTSSAVHHETSAEIFRTLYEKGSFTEIETEQYFDEEAGQFLADRYITGTCPKCGNPGAYGDQCEKCGTALSPMELINPKSALSGNPPVLRKTLNWFLPMDKIAGGEAFKKYAERVQEWKSNVRGQFQSWLDAGLQPRAMTRDLDWGVKVPLPGTEGKVLYVWFEAPIGYISATREYFTAKGDAHEWENWWKSDNTRLIHFIGKDNIVFHTIIFPMVLLENGGYTVPWNVPANEFLNLEGEKLSTSRNWAIWLHEYLRDFPGRQDELRYVLTSIAPETKDSDFTWKDYQGKVNSELVSILGNFVNRVMVLSWKYFNGKVQDGDGYPMFEQLRDKRKEILRNLENFNFRAAQFELMDLARGGNKFLQDNEPWKLFKTDEKGTGAILNTALQVCAWLAELSKPFLPKTSEAIFRQLDLKLEVNNFWNEDSDDLHFTELLKPGHQLAEAALLFKPVEDAEIEAQVNKLKANAPQVSAETKSEAAPLKAEISYDDFAKLDLRVGTILEAEKVEGADKLLKLTIDLGFEKRTVVSGIALSFKPEDIIGMQVTLLANLAPRKIRGVESKGMILMADVSNGKLSFVSPDDEVAPGNTIS